LTLRTILFAVTCIVFTCACGIGAARERPASTHSREIVITREQFGDTITISTHDTLLVTRPADYDEWRVDYAADVLRPLDAPSRMRRPGARGWRFAAVARGETDLTFTPVVRDSPPQRAAPAALQFSLTVKVQ
jgi:hypothetical protein